MNNQNNSNLEAAIKFQNMVSKIDPTIFCMVFGVRQARSMEIVETIADVATKVFDFPLTLYEIAAIPFKRARSKQRHRYYNRRRVLLNCFWKLTEFRFEEANSWTAADAALFLRTLETFDPTLSRLFTKVFNSLINNTELTAFFLNSSRAQEKYNHLSSSDAIQKFCVFDSLRAVVKPSLSFSECKNKVLNTYKLRHHYLFPVEINQLCAHCRSDLSIGGSGYGL